MSSMQNYPQLSVISVTQTPNLIGRLVLIFSWLFIIIPLFMLFLPWQQNISAKGFVSAFAPADRQQTVDSPISGRILKWYVKEGSKVKQGDTLLEVTDIDPNYKIRLKQQLEAYQVKLDHKQQELNNYQLKIERLETVRDMKVTAAQYKLDITQQKLFSANETLASAKISQATATQQKRRFQRLLSDGLVSRRDSEVAERDAIIAKRAFNSAKANVQAVEAERNAAQADIDQFRADSQAKIDSTQGTINKINGEIQDVQNNIVKAKLAIARQSSQLVKAPQDGTVLRLLMNPQGQIVMNPQGQIVKKGDSLLILVPKTLSRAVEVWVSGNDAPLILPGHHVRLMFEGWPAVQFVGWPEVAVGTFGGTVSLVDASDNRQGKFRVLVIPDETDHLWPSSRFLRQGGAVKAWILLEQVSVGYEIWRQLNGFPPTLT